MPLVMPGLLLCYVINGDENTEVVGALGSGSIVRKISLANCEYPLVVLRT